MAAAAAIGCLVVKELSSQTFAIAVSHLGDVVAYLSRKTLENTTSTVLSVHQQLQRLVPTAKLKIIQAVLYDFEPLRQQSKTVDTLMERLAEVAQTIHYHVQQIQLAEELHEQKYFKEWRSFDVAEHMEAITAANVHLEDSFQLLTKLLPSCIVLSRPSTCSKPVTPKLIPQLEAPSLN
jgi:hypothetical protein